MDAGIVDPKPVAAARLPFTFRFSGGAGRLVLADCPCFGWLHVDRLELDVPDLPLPFDLSGGPEKLQRRRTRVRSAALHLDQRSIDRLVARAAARLDNLGVDLLRARVRDGFVSFAARVREGSAAADVSFRCYLAGAGPTLRVVANPRRRWPLRTVAWSAGITS